MGFLAPSLLLGAFAIASPIVIHLLARRQVKRVPWAAMRFLQKAVERNQRRMNLEDVILMCLRCLLFLLLAFALARPALHKGSTIGFRGRDEVAIILIDASLSMSQTDGVTSLFEQAQQAAEQILDSLPGDAPAAVWLVTDAINALTPDPTKDTSLNRKLIREAQRTDRSADWASAIGTALRRLAQQSASVKQLFIVTDGQAQGWRAPDEAVALLKEEGKGILTHVILLGDGESRNLAITSLRLASAYATVNEPLQFEAELTNFGSTEAPDVALSLALDGGAPVDEQLIPSTKPGTANHVILRATFQEPGIHAVTVRHAGDRCPADDTRTFAFRILDEINVLLVDGDPGSEPREGEVFYLRHALAPVAPEMRARYVIKTRVATEAELASISLADFDAVVLANVADLSDPISDSLVAFTRSGGGLMIFPGDKSNASFYDQKLHAEIPLLPAAFGPVFGTPDDPNQFTTLQAENYSHPIVSIWNDPSAGSLATTHFFRRLRLTPGAAEAAKDSGTPLVVLRYADGEPAVIEHSFGAGRVVQFSSTADSAWNDLCARPLFVPFVHRCLGALLGTRDDRLNLPAGSPFSAEMPLETADKTARVSAIGEAIGNGPAVPIRLQDGTARFNFSETNRAVGYEVRIGEDALSALRFAAQSDAPESNLEILSPAAINALSTVAQITRSTTSLNLRQILVDQRNGAELWLPLAWILLGLAVTETIVGNRWSRSK